MKLDFGLSADSITDSIKASWPYKFGLLYSVTLDRESLNTTLVVTNDGDKPFDFQMLLHTYLSVKVRHIYLLDPISAYTNSIAP